jgi:hypothetical protein
LGRLRRWAVMSALGRMFHDRFPRALRSAMGRKQTFALARKTFA